MNKGRRKMNKKGGFSDLFLLIIFSLIIVFVSGILIYIGLITSDALHEAFDDKEGLNTNMTLVIDETIGVYNESVQALYWISIFLIVGMVIAIFIGSYMVTTKPIYFFPYIFIVIIAIVVAVGISMAYVDFLTMIEDEDQLADVFDKFTMSNFMLSYLPIWVAVIGIIGGVIMASRMGTGEQSMGGYVYG